MVPHYYETLKLFGVSPPPFLTETAPSSSYESGYGSRHFTRSYRQQDTSDCMSDEEAQRRAVEIAADFCSLVQLYHSRASLDPSTKEDEHGAATIGAQNDSEEAALLENLHSNWQALRERKYRENPKIEFPTIARGFMKAKLKASREDAKQDVVLSSEATKPAGDAEPREFPSSEPMTLFEQIIQAQNRRVVKWVGQRKEWNRAYLATRPDPNAQDDNSPDKKPIYYYPDCFNFYRTPDQFMGDGMYSYTILQRILDRTRYIEQLNERHVYWEHYERDAYPQEWRERLEKHGGYANLWEFCRVDDEGRTRTARDREVRELRRLYKDDVLSGAGFWHSVRIRIVGYPEELMTYEEKAKRDGKMWRKMWVSLRDALKMEKDGEADT